MKYPVTLLMFTIVFQCQGQDQDTTYFDWDGVKTTSTTSFKYYEVVERDKLNPDIADVNGFYKEGSKRSHIHYSSYSHKTGEGERKEWFKSGTLSLSIELKDGRYDGQVRTYWENGQLKRDDEFEKGKFISGRCFNTDGIETIHYDYEIMPEFPGGINAMIQYLVNEIKYPRKARRNDIQGKVFISFIVEKDGSLSHIKIAKSVNEELDEEALRVVKKMPRWSAGVIDGEKARVTFNLPINFKLR